MISAVRVTNAFVARKAMKFLKAGKDKKAQKLAKGFVDFMGPSAHGAVQQKTVDAAPGTYVLVCFMSTQDGREHTRLGMLRMLTIKK
jgi:hypothetical protein